MNTPAASMRSFRYSFCAIMGLRRDSMVRTMASPFSPGTRRATSVAQPEAQEAHKVTDPGDALRNPPGMSA
ncbi:MAG: hypothetical protein HY795_06115 [Desulfovibrio sp.]|nr:hypothetical protein [Desulfovibrio sp.]MBI4961327.1 hypothetical protein [Desulfovibrio sp.]